MSIYVHVTNMIMLFDVTTLIIARKPVKLQKEIPAGCDGKVNRVK